MHINDELGVNLRQKNSFVENTLHTLFSHDSKYSLGYIDFNIYLQA